MVNLKTKRSLSLKQECNVLIVDDEVRILDSIERQLRKSPYNIIKALSGDAALELISTNDIQIIITDVRMPGISGIELLNKISELQPNIVRIVLTGDPNKDNLLDNVQRGLVWRFIEKPWTKIELMNAITDAQDYHDKLRT